MRVIQAQDETCASEPQDKRFEPNTTTRVRLNWTTSGKFQGPTPNGKTACHCETSNAIPISLVVVLRPFQKNTPPNPRPPFPPLAPCTHGRGKGESTQYGRLAGLFPR